MRVMERTDKAAVVPADIGWSDVGNWAAVWELSDRDENGNSIRGHGVVMNASNVHIRSDDHLTTVVGVDNVIVVTTQDAVLVLNRAHGDQVKQLVDRLKAENRSRGARTTSAPIGPGAIINRSIRARAIRSSASS